MSGLKQALARTGARAGLLTTVFVAALAVSGLGASSASATCTGGVLKGEGSSLQKIAQTELWGPEFEATQCGIANPEIDYFSTDSGPGLETWRFIGTGTLNTAFGYIGTDDAPNGAQINHAREVASEASVAVVPVAQAAIAIVVHPPANCSVTKITNAHLEEAFSGKMTSWSSIGTGAGCTSTLTRVVPRAGSGTTYQFKNYLSQVNSGAPCAASPTHWAQLEEIGSGGTPNIEWPECGTMAPETAAGDGGVAATVVSMAGTIGFAGLPDAMAQGATIIEVQNGTTGGSPTYASPEAANESSNCSGVKYTVPAGAETEGLNKDWSGVFGGSPTIGGANYSICGLTYDLAWHSYATAGFTQSNIGTYVKHYIDYILTSGFSGHKRWYYPLPTGTAGHNVQKAAEKAMGEIS